MSLRGRSVLQQRRSLAHIYDHDLFVAVVIQVAHGEPARSMHIGDAASGLRRQIVKLAVATIPVESIAFV